MHMEMCCRRETAHLQCSVRAVCRREMFVFSLTQRYQGSYRGLADARYSSIHSCDGTVGIVEGGVRGAFE